MDRVQGKYKPDFILIILLTLLSTAERIKAVSYTHLDVYKRQGYVFIPESKRVNDRSRRTNIRLFQHLL